MKKKSSTSKYTPTAEQLIHRSAQLPSWFEKGGRLLELQQVLDSLIPSGLACYCKVANHEPGKIVLHAENGAVASRLRQMAKGLALGFERRGIDCREVSIRVQSLPKPPAPRVIAQRPIPAGGRLALQALADSLPENSPLHQGLIQLLQHSD